MVSTRDYISCGKRFGNNDKLRVTLSSLHIFVITLLFLSPISDECFICEACHRVYKNWSAGHNVKEILSKIGGWSKYTDSINERYEETGNGNVSNDNCARVLDTHKYSKNFFS